MNTNVIFLLGRALILLSIGMALSALVAVFDTETVWLFSFLSSSILTFTIGGTLALAVQGLGHAGNDRRNAILFAVLFWLISAIFAALPFLFGGVFSRVAQGFFEAMSGLTTTGATVLTDLENQPRSLIFWRALLQWYGGLVSVIFAVSLLNTLGIEGIGASQSHLPRGDDQQIYRRIKRATFAVFPVYTGMTLCAAITLVATGVSPFEGLIHAMTALSTGGFSTRDGGLAAFQNPIFTSVVLLWCVIGALNFTLHWAMFRGRRSVFKWDSESRMVVRAILGAAGILFVLMLVSAEQTVFSSIWFAAALSVSALTTAGFVVVDTHILPLSVMLFLGLLILIGPSTGSTAGGFKILKAHLLFRLMRRELIRLPNPRSVRLVQYAGARVTDDFMRAIWVMFGLYVMALVVGTLGVAATGQPLDRSLSATLTALGNAGAFFDILASEGRAHSRLNDQALWILSIVMMVGRLELLAIMAMLTRIFWRT